MMQIDSGTVFATTALSDETMNWPSRSRPGSVLTTEPVATMRFLAWTSFPFASIVLRSRRRPLAWTTSILFFFMRY